MSPTPQYRRLLWVKRLLCIGLGALSIRLVDLQVFRHERLLAMAETNRQSAIIKPPMRGQVRDIRGNLLAASVPAKRVCADPSLIAGHQIEVARAIAPILNLDEATLLDRLTPRTHLYQGRVVTNSYVVLKTKVPLDVWRQVEATMTNLVLQLPARQLKQSEKTLVAGLRRRGIFAEDDQIRAYPNQSLAAHVIGFVTADETLAGLNGIEATFNTQLSGVPGWRRTEVDTRRRELVTYRDQDVEPVDGMNVVLTIDSGLQYIVESELADAMREHTPASICCTVIRPRTGEILAMATLPTFDPNFPGAAPMDALRNRAIADVAEPGSTFKIVVISGALNEGIVHPMDQVDCGHGLFLYAGHRLHDHGSHGLLTVQGVITKSSNIGAAKVGIILGQNRLYDYIRSFGFGELSRLPLPQEVRGIVHPIRDWTKVSIAQIPMGQGVAVTPLQMVMAMSAIANHGKLMRPMLVNRLETPEGRVVAQYQPQFAREVVSEKTAGEMVQMLKTVVTPEGTASSARLDNYTVAGKTGTAQKVKDQGGYYTDRYFSSFIGFFPADNPELCISVVMDDPKGEHFGSQVAAPTFKRIAQKAANYFNIPPDAQPMPRIRATLADGRGHSGPARPETN
jgi:cell division protein FtsI/penicillin-binding protein 2